jgi:hypothetical protein
VPKAVFAKVSCVAHWAVDWTFLATFFIKSLAVSKHGVVTVKHTGIVNRAIQDYCVQATTSHLATICFKEVFDGDVVIVGARCPGIPRKAIGLCII